VGIHKPRPDFDPGLVVRAVCPGCASRTAALVAPACQVCDGQGVITLGRRALAYDTPEAVSLAVQMVLEGAAEAALASEHRARVAPRVLPETVARLVRLGLIERPADDD
jgi:hypothetical protein